MRGDLVYNFNSLRFLRNEWFATFFIIYGWVIQEIYVFLRKIFNPSDVKNILFHQYFNFILQALQTKNIPMFATLILDIKCDKWSNIE